jgi:hypothetical protein
VVHAEERGIGFSFDLTVPFCCCAISTTEPLQAVAEPNNTVLLKQSVCE